MPFSFNKACIALQRIKERDVFDKEEDIIKEPITDKIGQMVDKYLKTLNISEEDLKRIKPKKQTKKTDDPFKTKQ